MPTRVVSALVVISVLSLSITASAAEVGTFSAGIAAGFGLPTNDGIEIGFAVGATGEYLVNQQATVGAEIIYNSIGSEDLENLGDEFGTNISLLQVAGKLKYFTEGANQEGVFVIVRAGVFTYSVENTKGGERTDETSTTDFGVGGGAGYQLRLAEHLLIAVEGTFTTIFLGSDPLNLIGGTIGLSREF